MRVRSHVGAAIAAALFALAAAPAQSPAPSSPPKQALAEARALAGQAKGKTGPERAAALEAGARKYLEVAEAFTSDSGLVAEASFEAAELWRRRGTLAEAERAYRVALERDPARYEARASFELAHLLRRGKKFDEAVELYRKVGALQPGTARGHSALLWIGRTQQAGGKLDEAIASFTAALGAAPSAAAAITAGNWLAKAKLRKGDLAGARATIGEVEQRTAAEAAGDTPAAKRLQTALAEMSARRALQRAADKGGKAAEDAVDLEESDDEESEEGEGAGGGAGKPPGKTDRR